MYGACTVTVAEKFREQTLELWSPTDLGCSPGFAIFSLYDLKDAIVTLGVLSSLIIQCQDQVTTQLWLPTASPVSIRPGLALFLVAENPRTTSYFVFSFVIKICIT